MKNLFKNKILIILILLSVIKVILCAFLPMFYVENFAYDDALMIKQANSLFNGDYLGDYNTFTLVKGFFFPLVIAVFHFLHIPIGIGLSVLYILACTFFCFQIRDIFNDKKWIYILYIFLLFNPISFASETFERLYRNSIGPTQILFLLGFLYGVYKSKNNKELLLNLIGTGFILISFILTREDFIWIIPAVFITFIVYIIKNKNLKSLCLLVPIFIVFISLNITSSINKNYYDIKVNNELNESNFKKTYLEIVKIKPDKIVNRVSIPKSSLEKAYTLSPTFKKLKEDIDYLYEVGGENYKDEIPDGYLFWLLRITAAEHGYYENALKAEEFWGKVYEELSTNLDKVETRTVLPSIFLSPITKDNFSKFCKELPKMYFYVLSYNDVKTFSYDDLKKSKNSVVYNHNPNSKNYDFYKHYTAVIMNDVNGTADINKTYYKGVSGVFNIITFIYKYLSIVINIFGLISFVILIVKKQFKNLLMPIIVFASFITLLCGVTYTHVSAFEAMRYFYLGPAYILLITFSIMCIYLFINYKKNNSCKNN